MKEIEKLNKYVNQYYNSNLKDGNELNFLLQKISGLLFYLESIRSETHDLYEKKVHELVKEKYTVARAINEANILYPQMYQLRRVLDSGYKITDAIRTNISFIKKEMTNA